MRQVIGVLPLSSSIWPSRASASAYLGKLSFIFEVTAILIVDAYYESKNMFHMLHVCTKQLAPFIPDNWFGD